MNSRDLVLACLDGQATARPPVVCPGGMMSFAVQDVMQSTGHWWPEAHGAQVHYGSRAVQPRIVRKPLADVGVDIPAPACGVVATTPVCHLRALSSAARCPVA